MNTLEKHVRNARIALAMLAGPLAGTCMMAHAANADDFAYGADIGWVQQMEANGYTWKNSAGVQKDILLILKEKGVNAIRLRVWVNPSTDPASGHNSIEEVAVMARRVQDAGFRVMIDYHFGDTWNSVGTQKPPVAWANYDYAQMKVALGDYVTRSMNVLKTAGVAPTWVQIGNEQNSGILGYVGSFAHQPAQMTGLLNIAYDKVKLVSPSSQVIIHLAQPQYLDRITTFFDTYQSLGGKWDVSGFSSYPGYASVDGLVSNIDAMRQRYGKPVILVETGGAMTSADSVARMVTYYTAKINAIGGQGAFLWEPEGYKPFTDYGMTAWDGATQMPTNAMNAFLAAGAQPWGGKGYVRLKNVSTGLVADGMGSTTAGAPAAQWHDGTSFNQQWEILGADAGYIRLKNRATGMYLDGMGAIANGSPVGEWTSSTSWNQHWLIETVNGYAKFKNRSTGLYIDGAGATTDGAQIKQYGAGTALTQSWKVVN